jgi:EAL domain-containing protein (putative c-di-GMP-specific phosphodiesterase class I)
MYESKKRGRNCVTMFKDEMAMQAAKLLQLERDITTAMKEDQFCFVLQPIYDSSTSSIVCAEALIRWQKGDETISPDSFIPFLEESSLIIEVGDIMLDKVCAFLSMLKTEGKLEEDFRIAVNISGKQFSDDHFLERVIGILRKHQVAGHHLELEITESVALENLADTIEKIHELKKLKISFSLDDFGTGYSSLSHLKDLPVDKLKIDRSFINDISIDKQDENLVRSIIQLSDNLGLVTVAEGVETQQQLDWLCSTGHLLIQGYLFSKPLSPDIFYSKFFRDE